MEITTMNKDKIFEVVKDILHNIPQTRESDPYLCFQFYKTTVPNFRPSVGNPMTVNDFFEQLHHRNLPAFSSITRAKRLVMEHYVELRGKNYKIKKTKGVKNMVDYVLKKKNDEPQIRSAKRTLNGHYRSI
jgi:iron only hydrogenase large subunit-like protein